MFRMNKPSTKRGKRGLQFTNETLETRQVLSAGAGNSFALLTANIAQPNGTDAVHFTLDSRNFSLPHGRMVLGIDVAAATNSSVNPKIVSITDPYGHTLAVTQRFRSAIKGMTDTAVLIPIKFFGSQAQKAATFTVNVAAQKGTSGAMTVDFYLPGDVTGTGAVTASDLKTIKSLFNVNAKSSKYNFSADTNRDGRINFSDYKFAKENLGVATTIEPYLSSNLSPGTDTAYPSRLTTSSVMNFYGTASPGASITYTSPQNLFTPVTTTADSSGNYTLTTPLVKGMNYFNVSSTDSFGQTIAGSLTPIQMVNTSSTSTNG